MNPLAALVKTESRADPSLALNDYLQYFTYGGNQYLAGLDQTLTGEKEKIGNNFTGYVNGAYRANGIVFAVMLVRLMLFSEARFMFRELNDGRPGRLFYTSALDELRKPWPGSTSGALFARGIQDADLAGNFYAVRTPQGVRRRRPDWMSIALGVREDNEEEIVGYFYEPGGAGSGRKPIFYEVDQVAHFAPIPDPLANYRGMSWLTPVIREIEADSAASKHKLKFFENGATPNMIIKSPVTDPEKFKTWIQIMEERHAGVSNAYRSMYLGGGADATVVGTNFQQLDFKATQGAGETRIAAAGGIHPVVVGLSEGLSGSSLNAGNYAQARRRVSDGTLRPLWRDFAGSFETLVPPPSGAELWYDDRDIAFLQDDQKDTADIQQKQSSAIRQLVDGGFEPDTVIAAVQADDMSLLRHTGKLSVQLQSPDQSTDTGDPDV